MILCRYIFIFLFFMSSAYGQSIFLTPDNPLAFTNKKRITEILNRDNYGLIEPYFYASNRPTIEQALADEIKNRTLISPMNDMVYCPNGRDYFTNNSLNTGTIYIGAENLPKNGRETNLWFDEAYRYRKESDPLNKPANVAIISAERQNFLQVRCPNTHNNIIVSSSPAPAPIIQERPQLNIDTVKNLRYGDTPNITWNTNDYTLPSTMKNEYIRTEEITTGILKPQEINPPQSYIALAREASSENGVLLKFLLAIAEVSSRYNQNKISEQGTKLGIMQIPNGIAKLYKIDREDLFNPQKSFNVASIYIKKLNEQHNGDINKVLQSYYLGLNPNDINPDIPNIPQANVFAADVIRRIDIKQPIVF